jgi:hypothetical protein
MSVNFGSYGILSGTVHNFEKQPEWEWRFKPVTSGMELEMSKFNLHYRIVTGPDGVRRELPPTWMEIAHREIAITFAGTTISKDPENPVSQGGEPALGDGASVDEVERFIRDMPQGMVMELWKKVGQLYPAWGPADPNSV